MSSSCDYVLVDKIRDLAVEDGRSNLSARGQRNAAVIDGGLKAMLEIFRNQYDPENNPDGVVVVGVADNALMRSELVSWLSSDKLKLQGPELNYGDRIFSSTRLVKAICRLCNDVPVGLSQEKPKLVQEVQPDHIVVAPGATGILDSLFYVLCDPGDGILLSTPYYNGFDHDLTARAEATIIEVATPLPEAWSPSSRPLHPSTDPSVSPDIVEAYKQALQKARHQGTTVRIILVCNPHNPTGLVYPRATLLALASLAAAEGLHFVVDEIYARSVFESPDLKLDNLPDFESILSIDVEKEAGLPRKMVHVVSSASKDFGINGFRLGVYVNQGNEEALSAMSSLGILAQTASPAGALWYTWIEDAQFLNWYFKENHRRMANAYGYVTTWARHHKISYIPSYAGHFVMINLRPFLQTKSDDDAAAREAEAELTQRFLDNKVFVAPGAQYHHPIPGWFRFTFSLSPQSVREGLRRMESVLGLEPYIESQPLLSHTTGSLALPQSPAVSDSKADEAGKAESNDNPFRPTVSSVVSDWGV